jgi:hypothetical protein
MHQLETKYPGNNMFSKIMSGMGTNCFNNPYFVNISTSAIEDFGNVDEIEDLENIQKQIEQNKNAIEKIQKEIKTKNELLATNEKLLSDNEPDPTKMQDMRVKYKDFISKKSVTNNDKQVELKKKVQKINEKIKKSKQNYREDPEKYEKKIKKYEEEKQTVNNDLDKLTEYMLMVETFKLSKIHYDKMKLDIDQKQEDIRRFIAGQKEMLIRRNEILKQYMQKKEDLVNEQKRIDEENEKNAQQMLEAEKERLQRNKDEKVDEVSRVDVRNTIDNHEIDYQQPNLIIEDDDVDFAIFNQINRDQKQEREREKNLVREQKERDKLQKGLTLEQLQEYEESNHDEKHPFKVVVKSQRSKPRIGNQIQLLDFINNPDTKGKTLKHSRGRKQQSAQELQVWRENQQGNEYNVPKQSISKKSNDKLPSTHNIQENLNTNPNVEHNQNNGNNSHITVQKVDPSKSFAKIAGKNTPNEKNVKIVKLAKTYRFKCCKCRYQCDEWNIMVEHIFQREDHLVLQTNYTECKENDEVLSIHGDNSNPNEEMFKKLFDNLHISGVSSGYSINNDYDRSGNYNQINNRVDNRIKHEGESGYDRAFRREAARQGKSRKSNFGHNRHF